MVKTVKILKEKRVVILLNGRYAGRKAVIIKPFVQGDSSRTYGHCVVAGIDRYPRKVTKRMSQKKVKARSTIKPFLKIVNLNHLMPTRFTLDAKLDDAVVNKAATKDATSRSKAKKEIKKKFQTFYNSIEGNQYDPTDSKTMKNAWFFSKLRF